MLVIVLVPVKRQRAMGAGAEERAVFRGRGNVFGCAMAADMGVEADHPVRGGHDDVQLVADHQDGTAKFGPDLLDGLVEGRRTGLIEALRCLVEDQKLRIAEERAGQQHALELAAGKAGHLAARQLARAGAGQRGTGGGITDTPGQAEEPPHGDRQGRVDMQPLRNIADAQARAPGDAARGGGDGADDGAQKRRLAGTVGADDGDDLARGDVEIDMRQHGLAPQRDAEIGDRDEAHAGMPSLQLGQRPSTSITARSMVKPASRAARPRSPLVGSA